jgi:hypothetical protein
MPLMRPLLLLLLILLASTTGAQTLRGRVLTEKGEGAASVTVRARLNAQTTVTDKEGRFSLSLRFLPDTLQFSGAGFSRYQTVVGIRQLEDRAFEVVLLFDRKALAEVQAVRIRGTSTYNARKAVDLDGKRGEEVALSGYASGVASTPVSRTKAAAGRYVLADSLPRAADAQAKVLTAGEVNDFSKWKLWEDYTDTEFRRWAQAWGIAPRQRYCVQVQNSRQVALPNQPVYLISRQRGDTVWQARTDNTGKAELWAAFDGGKEEGGGYLLASGGQTITQPLPFALGINQLRIGQSCKDLPAVDIAFVVDATGSMGDEIEFLKLELEDLIRHTASRYSNTELRVGSVFYRDRGDAYLTRVLPFTDDPLKAANFVKLQEAGGGGDTPEAVDAALGAAIDSLAWRGEARTRLLFLILDAPPHDQYKSEIRRLAALAAAKGIRIIPIVCSGADKSTEYLMRALALATNGTYTFLTDDSGIGNTHLQPTTDAFRVERLHILLKRLLEQALYLPSCSPSPTDLPPLRDPGNGAQLAAFPNPTTGPLTLECSQPLKELLLTDFTGKVLLQVGNEGKGGRWQTSLAPFPSGTYLVRYLTEKGERGAIKVVKQ